MPLHISPLKPSIVFNVLCLYFSRITLTINMNIMMQTTLFVNVFTDSYFNRDVFILLTERFICFMFFIAYCIREAAKKNSCLPLI